VSSSPAGVAGPSRHAGRVPDSSPAVGYRAATVVVTSPVLAAATGLGGGFVRDLAIGALPPAAPALLGAALAVLAYETGTYGTATALAAVAAAATLRIVAMLRGWNAWRAPGTGRT
jgi:uncharacterized membrane protein YeiH